MLDTIRARLTAWYIAVLGTVLVTVSVLTYLLLARAIYARIDDGLHAAAHLAATSLGRDVAAGQDIGAAARSTTAALTSQDQMLAIYDGDGRLLAEQGRDEELTIALPPAGQLPHDRATLITVFESDGDDRHRLALRRTTAAPDGAAYVVVAGRSLDAADDELAFLRQILLYLVPGALIVAGLGGWALARQSLSPVMRMAGEARRMGVADLDGRLPVGHRRDELARLAETFNELLSRAGASLAQQRQFMAEASHELRTPVTTARTAAAVALQQPHRDEAEYRQALQIVEQQTARLSRLVDDMFTLARADAGQYPLQVVPLYLDEVVADVVEAARVLASQRGVAVNCSAAGDAPFTGDEELIRRMLANLVDNALRHAPPASGVYVELTREPSGYHIRVSDDGPGIPPHEQARIFERFQRGASGHGGGAGLGLPLARWIARLHGGDVSLAAGPGPGATFAVTLPHTPEVVRSSAVHEGLDRLEASVTKPETWS